MNSGYILGIVWRSGRPLQNAVIGFDWVRVGGQRLNVYRTCLQLNEKSFLL